MLLSTHVISNKIWRYRQILVALSEYMNYRVIHRNTVVFRTLQRFFSRVELFLDTKDPYTKKLQFMQNFN